MNRPITLLLVLCAVSLPTACGGEEGSMTPDGGVAADAGFVPDASYLGEGEPCELSIECGSQQLCVDDTCIRQERVAAAELTASELRYIAATDVPDSPLGRVAEVPWDEAYSDPTSSGGWADMSPVWITPGPTGPVMTFLQRPREQQVRGGPCQIGVLDDTLWTVAMQRFECEVSAGLPDGGVAVFGWDRDATRHGLVRFDRAGAEVSRHLLPETFEEDLTAALGADETHGIVTATSLLSDGDDVLVSAYLGYPPAPGAYPDHPNVIVEVDPYQTVFLRISPDGEVSLLSPGGSPSLAGVGGWLVRDHDEVLAIMRRVEVTDGDASSFRADLVSLETGEASILTEQASGRIRYAQVEEGRFVIALADDPFCTVRVVDSGSAERRYPWRGLEPRFDCPTSGPDSPALNLAYYVELPNMLVPMAFGAPHTPLVGWWFVKTGDGYEDWAIHLIPYAEDGMALPSILLESDVAFLGHGKGFGGVSRYGKSVEGIVFTGYPDAPLVWFEMALTRM